MNTVTLATHCHSRDLPRLHAPGELEKLIDSHGYAFDEILVTHQRCGNLPYALPQGRDIRVLTVEAEDYPPVLGAFGIDHEDPDLIRISHGWDWQWYFAHHCVNHCKEILEATSDYIVFCDADCRIVEQPDGRSWIEEAIYILDSYPEVFMVCPSDGGSEVEKRLPNGARLVRTTSQQLFIASRRELQQMNFSNLRWNGEFDAPGGPMAEWYGMMEGHLGRWMKAHGWYRAFLPNTYRYWHYQWH